MKGISVTKTTIAKIIVSFKIKLFVLLCYFALLGCTSSIDGNIYNDIMPNNIKVFDKPLNCQIEVDPIIDKRPLYETEELEHYKYRKIIPLLLFNYWDSAGPIFVNIENYDKDMKRNLQKLLTNTLQKSNICSENSDNKYLLKPELIHFYSVSYYKYSTFLTVAAVDTTYSFFPTGFICLKLTLINKNTSEVISEKYLSNAFLFNPLDETLSINQNAHGLKHSYENKIGVSIISLTRTMKMLPTIVDEMLSKESLLTETNKKNTLFTLVRLTKEYDFQEEIVVDYKTGQIISNEIVLRNIPIISKPNECVVAPYLHSEHWLSFDEYRKLITKLQDKYDIRFNENITSANFYGVKPKVLFEDQKLSQTDSLPYSQFQSHLNPLTETQAYSLTKTQANSEAKNYTP